MTKKSNGSTAPKGRTLDLGKPESSETDEAKLANLIAAGIASNAATVASFARGTFGEAVDLTETFRTMQAGGKQVQAGDLSGELPPEFPDTCDGTM